MIHAIVVDRKTLRIPEMSAIAEGVAEVAVFRNPFRGRHDRDLVADGYANPCDSISPIDLFPG